MPTASDPRAASGASDARASGAARPRRLAVLGSPIGHSQSPALHAAAYARLGLNWRYESADVVSRDLAAFIAGCGAEWRGLSLTMPLKQAVLPLLDSVGQVARMAGTANTLLFDDGPDAPRGRVLRGFNTDVAGIVRALAAAGLTSARFVHILGGGATAASAMVAAAELGAERVLLSVRSLERSAWLEPLAHSLGLAVGIRPLAHAGESAPVPELVISTVPGGVDTGVEFPTATRRAALLLDVAYDPWPSPLAQSWEQAGGRVLSGLAMLVHQALLQVRIFVAGDPLQPLDDEDDVLQAMLAAVGLDPTGVPAPAGERQGSGGP